MPSRKQRYAKLQAKAGEISAELEDLKEELEESLDNIPENLKGGVNAQRIEERISAFEDQIYNLDEILEFDWETAE